MRTFKLTEAFLEPYKTRAVNWGYGDLSLTTYKRSYARKKADGSIENWWETVQRVVEGVYSLQKNHCETMNLEWQAHKSQKSAQTMYEKIFDFKFTPPGRGLWAMGTDVIDKLGSGALNNCGFCSTETINVSFFEPFVTVMDFSMLGVGMGFDTKGANKVLIKEPKKDSTVFVVPDSREGWAKALELLLTSYVGGDNFTYDFSEIRPEGAPIKTFGGTAPGHKPLKDMLRDIDKVLKPLVGKEMTSVAIVDVMNLIGRCVVAGGIRRTALIAFGEPEDSDYIEMKDPVKFKKEMKSHRWSSNNSILGKVGMDYSEVAESVAKNGEPGIIWLENIHTFGRKIDGLCKKDYRVKGTNPCSEQVLEDMELCCLVECYPAHHETAEEWYETLKYAYLYAKSVTLVPTHRQKTNAVMGRNRRIGTSMSGIDQAITKFGRRRFFREFCDAGYKTIKGYDEQYSEWLCIPKSIRITSVKPSGTVSILAGAFPGIHRPHGKRYIRNVRYNKNSPYIKAFKKAKYLIEDDYYDEYTSVVSFPIEEKNFHKSKYDTSMLEQMILVSDMQYYWSDNAVSCTVTFTEDEKADIAQSLEMFETELKTVSMLPLDDHSYVQAPYVTVDDNTPLNKMSSKGYRIVWTNAEFEVYRDNIDSKVLEREIKKIDEEGVAEKFCTTDTCEISLGSKQV